MTSPSTARGPTTTSASTATRSSRRRPRARWRRPAPASTPSAPTPPTPAPPAPTRSPPAPPAPAATARPSRRRSPPAPRSTPRRSAPTTARRSSTRTARSCCSPTASTPTTTTSPTRPAPPPATARARRATDGVVYTADSDWLGEDHVPFTVSDGHGGSTPGQIQVNVNSPEPPTCFQGPIAVSVRPGRSVDLELACWSPQNDPQTYSHSAPSKGTLGAFDETGVVTYTANAGASGTDTFTLKASNVAGDSDPQTVTVTIDAAYNRAPSCNDNTFSPKRVATGRTTSARPRRRLPRPRRRPAAVHAPERGRPTAAVTSGPAATLDYTPAGGYTGTDSFTFVARDDRGVASPVVTEHLQVVASLAPTCTAGSPITLRPGQAKAVGFNCTDPDSQPVTYKIVAPPSGTLEPAGRLDQQRPHLHRAGDRRARTASASRASAPGARARSSPSSSRSTPTPTARPTCGSNSGVPQDIVQGRTRAMPIASWCVDPDDDALDLHPRRPGPAARHRDRLQRRHLLHLGPGLHRARLVRLRRQRRPRREHHQDVLGQRRPAGRADLRHAVRDQRPALARQERQLRLLRRLRRPADVPDHRRARPRDALAGGRRPGAVPHLHRGRRPGQRRLLVPRHQRQRHERHLHPGRPPRPGHQLAARAASATRASPRRSPPTRARRSRRSATTRTRTRSATRSCPRPPTARSATAAARSSTRPPRATPALTSSTTRPPTATAASPRRPRTTWTSPPRSRRPARRARRSCCARTRAARITFDCDDPSAGALSYVIDSPPARGTLSGSGAGRSYTAGATAGRRDVHLARPQHHRGRQRDPDAGHHRRRDARTPRRSARPRSRSRPRRVSSRRSAPPAPTATATP